MKGLITFLAAIGIHLFISGSIQAQKIHFLALGDSYTIGESVPSSENWPHQFERRLESDGRKVETTIIAETGWRTDELIQAIERAPIKQYDLVSISIGVNNQYQNRPFKQFENELDTIISMALERANNDTSAIFFVSIPDYSYTVFGQALEKPQISQEIDRYNAHLCSRAQKLGVPCIDVTEISRQKRSDWVASDDLHPSDKQYAAWVDEIYTLFSKR